MINPESQTLQGAEISLYSTAEGTIKEHARNKFPNCNEGFLLPVTHSQKTHSRATQTLKDPASFPNSIWERGYEILFRVTGNGISKRHYQMEFGNKGEKGKVSHLVFLRSRRSVYLDVLALIIRDAGVSVPEFPRWSVGTRESMEVLGYGE